MPSLSHYDVPERFKPIIAKLTYTDKFIDDDIAINYLSMGGANNAIIIEGTPQDALYAGDARYTRSALAYESHPSSLRINWPSNVTSTTQLDLLKSLDGELLDLIFQINGDRSIQYSNKLANKVLTLFNLAKEEDPLSIGISLNSLQKFFHFLQMNNNLKCPSISLTPENNIYASWRRESKKVFSVHFLPNGDCRFVIFRPNDRHPEKTIRISGGTTCDMLMETVKSHNVNEWASE
jgi:hypothetical protein